MTEGNQPCRFAFSRVQFVKSVYALGQLPEPLLPEVAFAGRSNVGKSSLINRLLNRRHLVKVSARPGKTQSLNFFLVDEALYLVDLPGYGFARVSRAMQQGWQELITAYLAGRENLRGVVVIVDLRHPPKPQDIQLLTWLRKKRISVLPVYTKMDKLSRNACFRQARVLDAGLGVQPDQRVLFSAKTGAGRTELLEKLDQLLC